MRKRLLAVVFVILVCFMCGCGNEQEVEISEEAMTEQDSVGTTNGKTVITLSYWNTEDTIKALLEFLAEEVPNVEIKFQHIENNDYESMIDAQLSFREGPDIICVSPGETLKHAKDGYLVPLNELAEEYSDAGKSVYSYEEDVYALPGISWFEGIWYNKEIFEENGIELPGTFDEYITVCKKFQELGIVPLSAGLKSWEPMLKNSMAFVTAEYLSTDSGSGFGEDYRNEKVAMEGTWNPYLEKWSEMITENIYTAEMLNVEHVQALEQFATGESAMFCSGPWDYDAIMEKNPDLQLDMMPFYGTQESDGWLIGGPGCGFALNAASENKEAAMEILAAISTYEGQAALWENNQGGSSYLKGAYFELPKVYESVAKTLAAGNVYCPWNEWGVAAIAHETYGNEMLVYFIGVQDLSSTLQHVDEAVIDLLGNNW